MHNTFERAIIAGGTGSGKSHLSLTGERNVGVLYCDRMGGDCDLQGLEDVGIHVWKLDPCKPRESALEKIEWLKREGLKKLGIRTVVWDTPTYTQKQVVMRRTGNNLNSMKVTDNKMIVFDVKDVSAALFGLEAHVVILVHLKEVPIKDNKGNILSWIWRPDLMPSILNDISRDCSLLGYTWKKTAEGKPTRYGICFTQKMGHTTFENIKAPDGWGAAEPANLRLLFKKLDDEAEARREAARRALTEDIDLSKGADDPIVNPELIPQEDSSKIEEKQEGQANGDSPMLQI
jgi:hypothetical protein